MSRSRAPVSRSLVWISNGASLEGVTDASKLTLTFEELRERVVRPARRADGERASLDNPAAHWLGALQGSSGLILRDVRLDDLEDLSDLYGFVLEPARRLGLGVVVQADRLFEELSGADFVDPQFDHP